MLCTTSALVCSSTSSWPIFPSHNTHSLTHSHWVLTASLIIRYYFITHWHPSSTYLFYVLSRILFNQSINTSTRYSSLCFAFAFACVWMTFTCHYQLYVTFKQLLFIYLSSGPFPRLSSLVSRLRFPPALYRIASHRIALH